MIVELGPENEAQRLAAVRLYEVLDTPPDAAFERITSLAAKHFDVPISIVSIVDTDRIWFKSHHGIDSEATGRDPGLCASAILSDKTWWSRTRRPIPARSPTLWSRASWAFASMRAPR